MTRRRRAPRPDRPRRSSAPPGRDAAPPVWWQRGVVYQVYPRSFQDTNGDGIGDLPGIRARLGYLAWLGVDAIWISPFYPSPMIDFGYDVSDHTGVDPRFGTLADFDALLADAHRRRIRIILDYVPNHTSDRHPWFLASRSSREDPRRDWYLWRDPARGGGPPSNWLSVFGGGAWTLDPATGQYYHHAFLREQPDLNWRHPAAREAMLDVLRFWLARGVDGFRLDALRHCVKDDRFRDNPPDPRHRPGGDPYGALRPRYSTDQPEIHELVAAMRRLVEAHRHRVLIGELYLPIDRLVTYYGRGETGLHLPFNFHLIETPWNARAIARLIRTYEAALPPGAWPNWVLGNHDRSRIASRVGLAQARVAAMLLLTLRGTPTLYYGDELGLADVPIPSDRVQDPFERNVPGCGLGRDPERTPMPWEPGPGAGFSTGDPWLPVGDDAATRNVALFRRDPGSILALYRRLLALRRRWPALAIGECTGVTASGGVLTYRRSWMPSSEPGTRGRGAPAPGPGPGDSGRAAWLVALNLTSSPRRLELPAGARHGRIALSTHLDRGGEPVTGSLSLRADEGLIVVRR